MTSMKVIKRSLFPFLFLILSLFSFQKKANGQAAIIVLIFGDQLATEKFHLSFDIGLNYTDVLNADLSNSRLGLNFGLGTHTKLSENFSLSANFNALSQQGAKGTINEDAITIPYDKITNNIQLNLLELPIVLEYNFNNYFIGSGISFNYTSSALQTSYIENDGNSLELIKDVSEYFKPFAFGLPFDLGYRLYLKKLPNNPVYLKLRTIYLMQQTTGLAPIENIDRFVFQFTLAFAFIKK